MSPKRSLGDKLCLLCFLLFSLLLFFFFLSFFRQKFVWHISRRCLYQTLWNFVGISYAMWSCAFKGWFFQNGCRCHGNGQNTKKSKKQKLNPPFFVFMATLAKFVQPIPIFLAYLVPLDVVVVPIKIHQFLFGE